VESTVKVDASEFPGASWSSGTRVRKGMDRKTRFDMNKNVWNFGEVYRHRNGGAADKSERLPPTEDVTPSASGLPRRPILQAEKTPRARTFCRQALELDPRPSCSREPCPVGHNTTPGRLCLHVRQREPLPRLQGPRDRNQSSMRADRSV